MATFRGILKGYLKSSANTETRRIMCIAAKLDIAIHPYWIAGKTNELTDALSRFDYAIIANWCPHWQTSLAILTF